MQRVILEEVPRRPEELEEYVAALFQASRYFVEKNVTERDHPDEILELDAVATQYEDRLPNSILAEAKSGQWGYPDVFKIAGWMQYLELDKGGFFVQDIPEEKDAEGTRDRCEKLNVQLVHLDDFEQSARIFSEAGFGEPIDEIAVAIWRFSFWVERQLLNDLHGAAGGPDNVEGPRTAKSYLDLVNNNIFFREDVRASLRALYLAYQEHPKLTLGAAEELETGTFNPDSAAPDNPRFRQAYRDGEHPVLQACMYVEHRARLAILKCAIDFICLEDAGLLPERVGRIDTTELFKALLPDSVLEGIARLRGEPNFEKYALFWQVFLWAFGGFYLEDRREEEFRWLFEHTGVPVEEIPTALNTFDVFFPARDEWLTTPGPTSCRVVKLVPVPFRGVGAYHRQLRYEVEDYDELGYSDYTVVDLSGWHNCFVRLLGD